MVPPPPRTPAPCNVCDRAGAVQLVPDRHEEDTWRVRVFCTRCLDEMLALFPLRPRTFRERELTGYFTRRR